MCGPMTATQGNPEVLDRRECLVFQPYEPMPQWFRDQEIAAPHIQVPVAGAAQASRQRQDRPFATRNSLLHYARHCEA